MSPVDFIHDQFGPAEFRIIRCCLKDCTRSELCIPPDLHLNKSSGISGLDPDFVRAARDALRIIAEDPEGDAFLEKWHALEEEYRKPLW